MSAIVGSRTLNSSSCAPRDLPQQANVIARASARKATRRGSGGVVPTNSHRYARPARACKRIAGPPCAGWPRTAFRTSSGFR
jgi:hypothetical protein